MSNDPWAINASSGSPAYSANELRQVFALGLMYGGRKMGGRSGIRLGGTTLQVTLVGSTITVDTGVACIDPGLSAPQGPYWVALSPAETHTLTAADVTNPRKDIVVLRVYDHDEDSSGNRFSRSEYIVGTPAASPAEPAVPSGAFRLATIDVPVSGGGSAVVTNNAPFTVMSGGILPVRDSGLVNGATEGMYRDRLDTDVLERYSGSAWATIADPAMWTAWGSWTPTLTSITVGNGTQIAKFKQVGKTVKWRYRLTLGSTSAIGSGPKISLPVTPHAEYVALADKMGWALALDAGTAGYDLSVRLFTGGTSVEFVTLGTTAVHGTVSSTAPFTWGTGDSLSASGTYEAA